MFGNGASGRSGKGQLIGICAVSSGTTGPGCRAAPTAAMPGRAAIAPTRPSPSRFSMATSWGMGQVRGWAAAPCLATRSSRHHRLLRRPPDHRDVPQFPAAAEKPTDLRDHRGGQFQRRNRGSGAARLPRGPAPHLNCPALLRVGPQRGSNASPGPRLSPSWTPTASWNPAGWTPSLGLKAPPTAWSPASS